MLMVSVPAGVFGGEGESKPEQRAHRLSCGCSFSVPLRLACCGDNCVPQRAHLLSLAQVLHSTIRSRVTSPCTSTQWSHWVPLMIRWHLRCIVVLCGTGSFSRLRRVVPCRRKSRAGASFHPSNN